MINRRRIFNLVTIMVLLATQFSMVSNSPIRVHAAPGALSDLTCTQLTPLSTSAGTGEKPQSKVWTHDGEWWAVLPASTPTVSSNGTWLWKLVGTTWTEVLKLSSETGTRADVKSIGNVAHILLYDGDPELVSVEYSSGTYISWTTRPTASPISLPSSETATIDIDSTGKMWLATESGTDIVVYYSDSPYSTWNGPVTIGPGVNTDDIAVVTALPDNTIGVLWSDQEDQAFGFRVHVDGADPGTWSADEVPLSGGPITADDHVNVAVASDGTLYAAIKTEPAGWNAHLLIRRPGPSPSWDSLYVVDGSVGSRPIVALNDVSGYVDIIHTVGSNIVYEESSVSSIDFSGSSSTLIPSGGNNASSTKQNYTDELVVISSGGGNIHGVFCGTSAVSASLVAHYEMEEDGGTILNDSSSFGNDGSIVGSPTWVSGVTGLSLDLNGTAQFATVPDHSSLDISDEITLAAWIKPERQATQRLIRKVDVSSGYSLFLSDSDEFSIRFNDDNNYRVNTSANFSSSFGNWIHIAATYDGTTIKTFVNGIPDNTLATSFSIAANTTDLILGAQTATGTNLFQGGMDDVRIYDRALSDGEILALASIVVDLVITKDDGLTFADPGDPVTYTIMVTNSGPSGVTGATVTDLIPAEVTGSTWTCVTTGGASCGVSGSGNISDLVDMPVSSTVTYTVIGTFDVGASGVVSNTAVVTVPTGVTDPMPGDNSATDTTSIGPLVAYFAMDEGSGTDLIDSSTYGNDGTLSGDPVWATSQASLGLALVFDGTNDYASVLNDASLDITTTITLAAWVKPGKVGTQDLIKKQGGGGSPGYEMVLSTNGYVFVEFNGGHRTQALVYRYTGDNLNKWVHFAATYDGTDVVLYVNGVQDGIKDDEIFTIGSNTLPLTIGGTPGQARWVEGQMDEVRVYNIALTPSEIAALAELPPGEEADLEITKDNGQTVTTPGAPVTYTIIVSNNGPNDVISATVTDLFPAVLTSASWTCSADIGANCTPSDSGDIDDTVNLPSGTSVTYTANATLDVGATGSLSNTASVAVPAGMTDPDMNNNTARDVDLPSAWLDQCGNDPNLAGCWLMEEGSGSIIYDSSGQGNHGTLYGDATWLPGMAGLDQALTLDGNGDYALILDDSSLDIQDAITLAVWVKPEVVGTQDLIKKAIQNGTDGFGLMLAVDGRAFTRFNQASDGNLYRLNSVAQYPDTGDTWVHLAVTYDGANIRFYYNGLEESVLPASITINANDLPLSIGAQSNGIREFLGQIDEVRIYSRALSSEEIKDLPGVSRPAEISSPIPGSTLSSSSQLFEWNNVVSSGYELYVGTSQGDFDIWSSGNLGTSTSHTVHGLPADGSTIFVRLWTLQGSTWIYNDYTYTSDVAAEISSPTPGSTLAGSSQLFEWNDVGGSAHMLYVGTTQSGSDIWSSGNLGTSTSHTVHGLPADGSTIFVRLWTLQGSTWIYNDYTYTSDVAAEISSPTPGSTLAGSSQLFEWNDVGASAHYLYVGTSQGGYDIWSSGNLGTSTSHTVHGLPTDGSTIFVWLWTLQGTTWIYNDYTYTSPAT